MADDDIETIRKGYAAFSAGDLAALAALYAEDATWTVPGSSPYAGTKQGRDAIIAFLVEVATISLGTYRTTNLALAGRDGRVFALDASQATRNGKTLDTTGVNVFVLKDGLVQSVQQYFEDTTASDAFWS
jgi:uncharacterized protein (TIGR02246 family)